MSRIHGNRFVQHQTLAPPVRRDERNPPTRGGMRIERTTESVRID